MAATRTWDIFCSVVDNYGDIGVCWRLARQLACAPARNVRLWVDDLASFHRLCPAVDPARNLQRIESVEVHRWIEPLPQIGPADVVVEGFGVRLPDSYLAVMAARAPRPAWINLEHLSAESWVEGHHMLPSPHPRLPVTKYFFFPGFTTATGGLLIENGLARARDEFQNDPAATAAFRRSIGIELPGNDEFTLSLFCYDNAALAALVAAWSSNAAPVNCLVPDGPALAQLAQITGRPIAVGTAVRLGSLAIHAIPFLEVDLYDRLLWSCDVNMVRGEDSFVRAQLAARPLVWHAYPQEDGAHLGKVSAFADHYADALGVAARTAYRSFVEAWNLESTDIGANWTAFQSQRGEFALHARKWAAQLEQGGSLAVKLAEFCEDRLE